MDRSIDWPISPIDLLLALRSSLTSLQPPINQTTIHRWFSFKLGQGDGTTPRSKAAGDPLKAASLVESTPYQLETHMAHTEDGFVLVLHRLVPRQASGAGSSEGNGNPGANGGNGGKRGGSLRFGRSDSNSNSAVRLFSLPNQNRKGRDA